MVSVSVSVSLLTLLAASSALVSAQEWNTWDGAVTKTITRTHTYCPCDDPSKPANGQTWATWTSSSTTPYSSYWTSSTTSPSSSSSSATTTTTTTTATTSTCPTGLNPQAASSTRAAFISSGIIPTLIPDLEPRLDVRVDYNGKAVALGNQFLTSETLTQPTLTFTAEAGPDPDTTTYSYFLVDPDVPSPNGAPVVGLRVNFLHWYVSGARSICATTPNGGQTVALYQPLTPASTDQHRYTFLVYREPPNYTPDVVTPQTRVGFDINTYANNAGLVLVGGNFLREAITNGVITSSTITTTTSAPISIIS